MTIQEFNREFDIQYDSIATNSAPGLDIYEKSVYLTRAQLEIVKNYFKPEGNKYKEGFEQSSKRRNDLKKLIKTFIVSQKELNPFESISEDSQLFKIPKNNFLIIQEQCYSLDSKLCGNEEIVRPKIENLNTGITTYFAYSQKELNNLIKGKPSIEVKPITHDEYNDKKDNPFKKPNEETVWRIEGSKESNDDIIELISPYDILAYKVRYVKLPKPIILGDLNSLFPNENLTVGGLNTISECELKESIHREILDRAVFLATGEYKPEELQVRAQINQRNE